MIKTENQRRSRLHLNQNGGKFYHFYPRSTSHTSQQTTMRTASSSAIAAMVNALHTSRYLASTT